MISTVFFDLDGTLLPMDQEKFITAYLRSLAEKMSSFGYDPALLTKSIWTGTGAMIKNDGKESNEEVFWRAFSHAYGKDVRTDEPIFQQFYREEFQQIRHVCGFDPRAAATVREIKAMGYQTVLATNPLFPAAATHSRIRWAGLSPEDFCHITTYENSSFCKPNPDYYREILGKLNLKAANCLMVGNDATEDTAAETTGMRVFLLTDCLIKEKNLDISNYPQGSFPKLLDYIRSL